MKKTVSLFLALCMMCVCFVQVSFAEETFSLPAVSIIAGQSYTLPEAVGDYTSISWTTTLDTNNVGIQTMKGTSGTTPVTMVVNVGEEADLVYSEDFETGYESLPKWNGDGYNTFKRNGGANVVFNSHAGVEILDGNYVFKVYQDSAENYQTRIQEMPNTIAGKPYRFNFKARFDLDKDKIAVGGNASIVRVCDYGNNNKVFAEIQVFPKDGKIYVQPTGGSQYEVCSLDANYSTGWMDFDVTTYSDCTYALTVNGKNAGKANKFYNVTATEVVYYRPASVSACVFDQMATVYLDDINVYGERYVTGTLPAELNAEAYTGTDGSGTKAIALSMSDDTTKEFDVKYTVPQESLTVGTTYSAIGTIDGFTQTILVNVTVKEADKKETVIKTVLNGNVTLPKTYNGYNITWDRDLDTTKEGRITYNGTTAKDTGIKCTVYVGDYNIRIAKDSLSGFEIDVVSEEATDQVTYQDKEKKLELIVPKADKNSVQVVDIESTRAIKFGSGEVSYSAFITPADTTPYGDAGYTIAYDYMLDDISVPDSDYSIPNNLRVITDNVNNPASHCHVVIRPGGKLNFQVDSEVNIGSLTQKSDGKYKSDWLHIEYRFYPDGEKKYDLTVNGTVVAAGKSYTCQSSQLRRVIVNDGIAGSGVSYMKNLEIGTYRTCVGTIPTSLNLVLGHNMPINEKIELTMSDNTTKLFDVVTGSVDGKTVGDFSVDGAVSGFSEKVAMNIKVCDYYVESLNIADGKINSAVIVKAGAAEKGTAVFAAYGSDGALKKIKPVEFEGSKFADGKQTISPNMEVPQDAIVKVFIFDSFNMLNPLNTVYANN